MVTIWPFHRSSDEQVLMVPMKDQVPEFMEDDGSSSAPSGLGPGTMIVTRNGEIPVEWLDSQDEVLTRDAGFQPILWLDRMRLCPADPHERLAVMPVRIPAGSLGGGLPIHDVVLSPNQLIQYTSTRAELYHGSQEVLIPASMMGFRQQWAGFVTYTRITLIEHHLASVEGSWMGTTFPSDVGDVQLDLPTGLAKKLCVAATSACRPILNEGEARVLLMEDRTARQARRTSKPIRRKKAG